MKECIERETAIAEIHKREIEGSRNYNAGLRHAARVISNAPAADVRENVLGEWVEVNRFGKAKIVCSACKEGNVTKVFTTNGEEYIIAGEPANFCPNCGAQMKEDKTQ